MELPVKIREMLEQLDSTTYNHSLRVWKMAVLMEAAYGMEAVLSPDFVEQYGEFLERMKKAGPDIRRMPGWEPLYKREALAGILLSRRKRSHRWRHSCGNIFTGI